MGKKEEKGLLEPKKRKLDAGTIDLELDTISSEQVGLLTTEQHLLKDLFEGDMKPSQTVFCVERHQRTKVGYLRTDTPACKWGRNREDATTCGDCPFGVKLMEFVPTNDAKATLRKLRREQDGTKNMFR